MDPSDGDDDLPPTAPASSREVAEALRLLAAGPVEDEVPTQVAGAEELLAARVAVLAQLEPVLPVAPVVAPAVLAALAAEEELPALVRTVKRKHVHYTHVRTHDPTHHQPESFSRAGFWEHLEKVYLEAYPVKDQDGISILSFGCVVKERHQGGDEHHHAAVFCATQHYWNKAFGVRFGAVVGAEGAVGND